MASPSPRGLNARTLPRLNLLFSYAYTRGNPYLHAAATGLAPSATILIDSGAFTNWAQRRKPGFKPFVLEDYLAAARVYAGHVWQYIAFDVIMDPDATWVNLQRMLDAGLDPMPVWQVGDTLGRLSRMADLHDMICIAGGVGTADRFAYKRYQTAAKTVGARARLHALGFLRYPDILQLPLFSGDSSSYTAGAQYGLLSTFTPAGGIRSVGWPQLDEPGPTGRDLRQLMLRCSMPLTTLANRAAYRTMTGVQVFVTVFAYLRMHAFCAARGFKVFLAIAATEWLSTILSVMAAWEDPQTFHYPTALGHQAELLARSKRSVDSYLEYAERLIRDHTAWDVGVLPASAPSAAGVPA